jgi:hypothetical protein
MNYRSLILALAALALTAGAAQATQLDALRRHLQSDETERAQLYAEIANLQQALDSQQLYAGTGLASKADPEQLRQRLAQDKSRITAVIQDAADADAAIKSIETNQAHAAVDKAASEAAHATASDGTVLQCRSVYFANDHQSWTVLINADALTITITSDNDGTKHLHHYRPLFVERTFIRIDWENHGILSNDGILMNEDPHVFANCRIAG